jgi:hypothetical protein
MFCKIDVTSFPYDKQSCELTMASWTYNAREVEMRPSGADLLKNYNENSEWVVLHYNATSYMQKYIDDDYYHEVIN